MEVHKVLRLPRILVTSRCVLSQSAAPATQSAHDLCVCCLGVCDLCMCRLGVCCLCVCCLGVWSLYVLSRCGGRMISVCVVLVCVISVCVCVMCVVSVCVISVYVVSVWREEAEAAGSGRREAGET